MKNQVTNQELKDSLNILGINDDMNSLMECLPQSFVKDGDLYEFYIEYVEGKYEANYINFQHEYILLCSYDYENIVDAIAYAVSQITCMHRNNEITEIKF